MINKVKRFQHPRLGVIALRQINGWTASHNGDRMLVYMPAEAQDKQTLENWPRRVSPSEPYRLPPIGKQENARCFR